MPEILTWGEGIEAEFARLGIEPVQGYQGGVVVPSVYTVTEEALRILGADPEEFWADKKAGWRHSDGCTLRAAMRTLVVNGKTIRGWLGGKHDTLLGYLCDAVGASNSGNVAACAAELAKVNGLTIAALFDKYQPSDRAY